MHRLLQATKCLYLTIRSLDPTGKGQVRWVTRWKPALNAFAFPLRRPLARRQGTIMKTTSYTLNEIDPMDAVQIFQF
ncbi:transposase [Bifidobacterium aquikefiri]|uniref:Transposase n=1 Tax=Bifidobacterium aquikefiri TaxID=1653207 RepID=A0A261G1R6_9BIFI|nr:transposase [Bifidobacterium aquikefiri]